MKEKIVVSVSNDLSTDQRVERTCRTLLDMDFEIGLFGRMRKNSSPISRPYNVIRKKLRFNRGPLFYLELNLRLFFFLNKEQPAVVLSNDLDTLLANFMHFRMSKKCKHLIYDSHEYFTEVPELRGRWARKVWLRIEKTVFPKLKIAYTVSPEIADIYSKKYNIAVDVIRNLPLLDAESERVKRLAGETIIIYQGAINMSRGIELMIECMSHLPDYHLYIFGDGDILTQVKSQVGSLDLGHCITFMGRVDPAQLRSYTSHASLGLSFEEDVCLNYRYALPNKIFDYIHAEVPILVSDLPSMKRIVVEYGVGEVLQSREPKDIAQQIKSICDGNTKRSKYIANCATAKEELCWEEEEKKLRKILDDLFDH